MSVRHPALHPDGPPTTQRSAASTGSNKAIHPLPPRVRKIIQEIEAHLFDADLSVQRVRQRCGLHNHNVSSRFKMHLGVGIRDYIEAQRVEAAKQMLRESNDEVYLIAATVGYEYVETFVRAFSRVVGCTPGEYRSERRVAS